MKGQGNFPFHLAGTDIFSVGFQSLFPHAEDVVMLKAHPGGKCACCCFRSHHSYVPSFCCPFSSAQTNNPFYGIKGGLGLENKLRSWLNFLQQVEPRAARCLAFRSWHLPRPVVSSLCCWQCWRIVLLLYLYKGVMD